VASGSARPGRVRATSQGALEDGPEPIVDLAVVQQRGRAIGDEEIDLLLGRQANDVGRVVGRCEGSGPCDQAALLEASPDLVEARRCVRERFRMLSRDELRQDDLVRRRRAGQGLDQARELAHGLGVAWRHEDRARGLLAGRRSLEIVGRARSPGRRKVRQQPVSHELVEALAGRQIL
jgi:hypothetical protein